MPPNTLEVWILSRELFVGYVATPPRTEKMLDRLCPTYHRRICVGWGKRSGPNIDNVQECLSGTALRFFARPTGGF